MGAQGVGRAGKRVTRMAFALVALALAPGCVAPRLPSAGAGAPARHVIRASQYAITTDYSLDRDDPLIDDLVKLRERIGSKLRLPMGREPIRIVIFETQQRYDEYLRRNFPELPARRAFFVKQGPGEMVVYAYRAPHLAEDLRHETTHALLHSVLPKVPIWLDEGLAEYFEAPEADRGAQPGHLERLKAGAPEWNLADLERRSDLWRMSAADYRQSWLWVHFCLEGPPWAEEALRAHIARLARGEADSLADRLQALRPAPNVDLSEHLAAIVPPPPVAKNNAKGEVPQKSQQRLVKRQLTSTRREDSGRKERPTLSR